MVLRKKRPNENLLIVCRESEKSHDILFVYQQISFSSIGIITYVGCDVGRSNYKIESNCTVILVSDMRKEFSGCEYFSIVCENRSESCKN